MFYPDFKKIRHRNGIRICFVVFFVIGSICIPNTYKEREGGRTNQPSYEYAHFSNSALDLQITGMYQYIVRDFELYVQKKTKDYSGYYKKIDSYFGKKDKPSKNEMTGVFEGKNLIFIMMESMDDWLVSEETTPTIKYMMNNGINFENFYTPGYSSGYTFNTEFASNTGIYPYSNGNASYSLSKNRFSESIASAFSDKGYSAESFHENIASYYNRGEMHEALGYSTYHSYKDYESEEPKYDDTFLVRHEPLFGDLIRKGSDSPFFSFVITISPHLPYTMEDEISEYAIKKEYGTIKGEYSEMDIIKAKAKLTDRMMKDLLERLKQEGILDDTVIIAYADHYTYGITDQDEVKRLSVENGCDVLERTPAFVYSSTLEEPISVEKVMQTTDLPLTISNLFNLEIEKENMGNDVFDERYNGYAIFPGGTWITEQTYVKDGNIIWNRGMTEEEIRKMNKFVTETYEINDMILDCDYYNYLWKNKKDF